jgi:hypothetical protein
LCCPLNLKGSPNCSMEAIVIACFLYVPRSKEKFRYIWFRGIGWNEQRQSNMNTIFMWVKWINWKRESSGSPNLCR